jgi:hypothetical protein
MKTKLLLFVATIIMSFGMNAQINSVAIVGTALGLLFDGGFGAGGFGAGGFKRD